MMRSPLNLQNQDIKEQSKIKSNPWGINKKESKDQQATIKTQKE